MEQNPILKLPLSLDSEIPLYSQLMGIIKRSITSGALKVGDLLPSEAELCRVYDISRNTVRQAIGALEEEGFVVSSAARARSSPTRTRAARACSIRSRRKFPSWAKRRRPRWSTSRSSRLLPRS